MDLDTAPPRPRLNHQPVDHSDEEEHEEHVNHEAWVIPYADMVTLLMALFLMLFALSTLDLKKFEAMAASLNRELDSDAVVPLDGDAGGTKPFDLEGAPAGGAGDVTADADLRSRRAEQALVREEQAQTARRAEDLSLRGVRSRIAAAARRVGLADAVAFERNARGLVVTVVSDEVLFAPGSAQLQPRGRKVLAAVAAAVRPLPNEIAIEGHTDNRPISTTQFPSNWELSTERATQVLRELVGRHDVPAVRVSASGYGEQRPLAPNATAAGRAKNRRVALVVLSVDHRPAG